MLSDARFLAGLLCGVAACSPQILRPPRAPGGPPEPPPITEREIVGTWVGTTVCRGIGSRPAMEVQLTIKLDHLSVDSCKTYVCEHIWVTGLFERFALGDAGRVPETVRLRGMLAGRGVSLYRLDRASGSSVHVLSGDVSI